ncbi:hypothetical protein PR048_002204 [Dryococelus australis]|uniref:Peptidase A2 domain-containing protein n=1 Tax=Dryococelus australis TaxID=614101 RepID=A0ABQ9IM19_9NEOP|nr:hypothetical protein PR048_002204 [Dryococelus australis]
MTTVHPPLGPGLQYRTHSTQKGYFQRNEPLNPLTPPFTPPARKGVVISAPEGGQHPHKEKLNQQGQWGHSIFSNNNSIPENPIKILTSMLDESERDFLLPESEESIPNSLISLCPEVKINVCEISVPTLLDSGATVSCVNKELIKEIENRRYKLPIYPVPRLKILGVTSCANPIVNKQTMLIIEELGERKLASVDTDSKRVLPNL